MVLSQSLGQGKKHYQLRRFLQEQGQYRMKQEHRTDCTTQTQHRYVQLHPRNMYDTVRLGVQCKMIDVYYMPY